MPRATKCRRKQYCGSYNPTLLKLIKQHAADNGHCAVRFIEKHLANSISLFGWNITPRIESAAKEFLGGLNEKKELDR